MNYFLLGDSATGGGGGGTGARPLDGPLRVMPGGYLGDTTGYRRIIMASDFPYFRLWETDNVEARRGKQAIARTGYHGSRDFHVIANDRDQPTPPGTYWYGADVTKDQFRRNAVEALHFSGSLGLRTVLSFGNSPISLDVEADWTDEWTQIVAAGDCQPFVAWIEACGNEVDVNRSQDLAYDVDVAMAHAARLQAIIRRNLPGTLITNGSFGEESTVTDPRTPHAPNLITSSRGADMMDIHNQRGVDFVKHSHTMWLDTHFYGSHRVPLVEGETGGENEPYPMFQQGGDVSTPCNDAHLLHTELSMQSLTGQAVIYLNGPGVRRKYPIDSTIYFGKVPKSLEPIPDDIPLWRDENNPSWWIRGKEFVYVGLAIYGQLANPPHPIAEATFYDMYGVAGKGPDVFGRLVPPLGWSGGIVRGVFV